MEIEPLRFREVMSRFATGVSVVTTFDGDRPAGITVNALSSVSLDPALVMIALDQSRFITPMVRESGRYAVNVLGDEQGSLSDCFAHAPASPGNPGREDFCGARWHAGRTGLPLLDGAIATLECTVVETFSAGDHDLFIGRVEALDTPDGPADPLLFFRRHYVRVAPASASVVEGKQEG
jgi:3-hydroxy-9,10-secoandrosta-1,3,5(10)-triene-9,17-dione monooxygenase reductase component